MKAKCKHYVKEEWHGCCNKIVGNSIENNGCPDWLPGNSSCCSGIIEIDYIDYIKYKNKFDKFFSFNDIVMIYD